jgi:hypothetical protein
MKKTRILMVILSILSMGLFTRCDTNKEKTEAAEVNLKDAENEFSDAKSKETSDSMKLVSVEEWALFKQATESKIQAHEIRIAFLKKSLKESQSKSTKDQLLQIDELEQRNKSLRERMETYEKVQSDWIRFKTEFGKDMDQLGTSVKNFTIPSKK